MKENNIEIIDENNEVIVDNNESASVIMPETKKEETQVQPSEPVVDKKMLKEQKKLNKKKKKEEVADAPMVEESSDITIIETAVTKGATGSQVLGNIEGDSVIATNNPLPDPIDITVKRKGNDKAKTKKVKVLSKKEKIAGFFLRLFVVLVLAGGGFSVYYFGFKTNPSRFTLKTIYLELGDHLPNTVSYYIDNSNKYDDMEYNLNIDGVKQNTIGTYTYTVTHKGVTKTAQVIVRDTKAPVLKIKDKEHLMFQKNASVNKDDIVISCEDISNCTYKTEYEISTETPGEKEINIIARDEAGNETKEAVTIRIVDIQKSVVCTSSDIESTDKKFKQNDVYTLFFDGNDYLVRYSGIKLYTYTDYEAYFAKLEELQSDSNYTFNRTNFTYSEATEVKTNNYTSLSELINYYNDNGFTCK